MKGKNDFFIKTLDKLLMENIFEFLIILRTF